MKMHPYLIRGAIVPVFLLFALASVSATARNSSEPSVPQILMRIVWGSGGDGAGEESSFGVIGFNHEVVSPRDAASGLPTGKRQHGPMTFTKSIDSSSTRILNAYVGSGLISSAELILVRNDRNGNPTPYHSIKMQPVFVTSYSTNGSSDDSAPAVEKIAIVYQEIEWNYLLGGSSVSDTWSQD